MTSDANDPPQLINSMVSDHQRFAESLDRLHDMVSSAAEPERTQAVVEEFEITLSRHIYAENEVLVPELEINSGSMEVHAVGAMLQDHDRIRSLSLGLLHMVKRRAEAAEILSTIEQLRDTLATHTRWEEEQVYPLLAGLGEDEHALAIMHGEEDEEIFGD